MKVKRVLGRITVCVILLLIALVIYGCEYHPRTLRTIVSDDGQHTIRVAEIGETLFRPSKFRIYHNGKRVLTFERRYGWFEAKSAFGEWLNDDEMELTFSGAPYIGFHFTFEDDELPSVYWFTENRDGRCAADAEEFDIRYFPRCIRIAEYAAKTDGE